eukprot:365247-Chlamydomonas_euryale.AAC.16
MPPRDSGKSGRERTQVVLEGCPQASGTDLQKRGEHSVPLGRELRKATSVCDVTTLDSSASASRMDQTGAASSYPTSTTARCIRERKAQGPEKEQTKTRNGQVRTI